jgi:hypothetical protein
MVKEKNNKLRVTSFIICNAFVFAGFSVLWAWQYHLNADLSDKIDRVVAPWLWFVSFFVASFFTLKRHFLKAGLPSFISAILFSFVLFIFVNVVLVAIFDRWF